MTLFKKPTLAERITSLRDLDEVEGWIMGLETSGREIPPLEVTLLERRIADLTTARAGSRPKEVSARLRAQVACQRGAQRAGGGAE